MTTHINNWLDGYLAVRDSAYAAKGAIEIDDARWPRTTCNDVITIAAVLTPVVRAHASDGLRSRWHEELSKLEDDALDDGGATYLFNRTFWATFEALAVYLDDVGAPVLHARVWDGLISLVSRARNAGPSEDGPFAHFEAKTYDDLFNAQRAFLAEKRGADMLEPPDGFGGGTQSVPRTTNADVLQLATYWTQQLTDTKRRMGYEGVAKAWQATIDEVDKLAKPGKPDDVYTKNNEFWANARRVAIQVAVSDEAPSKWSMVVSSIKDSVVALPRTVEHVAEAGAGLVSRAANTVGRVTGEISKGLFGAMSTPILVGAGLVGVYFLSRNRHEEA